jgi:branched-chain amino acid transport system permease protein
MEDFLQNAIAGLATGARYALVALGFVIIYKATGVINFAQGGLLVLGAYLTYALINDASLPFALALVGGALATALVGAAAERTVLRPMIGQPVFAVIMITIGLLFVIEQAVTAIWGFEAKNLNDPWGIKTVDIGDVAISHVDVWTFILAAAVLAAFFAFFRFSDWGVAMRATAFDQEAALAQGISARKVFALSWAIAGGLAALAGTLFAAGGGAGLSPSLSIIALAAFPAMIVGGLDSPAGAVIGGLIIGLTQNLVAAYQDDIAPGLGDGFSTVAPYVVMIIILLVRPYGLFGTPEVRRV